jgi:hypothetical protein
MRIAVRSLLIIGLAALPAGAAPPRATEVIPPASTEVIRQGELASYAGDQLFDYINGGAPQFLEYGFREVASQEILYRGHTYIFDTYRMRDAAAAFGVFSIRRPRGAPRLAAYPHSACGSYQSLLAHGVYYIEVAAYEAIPETCAEIEELVALAVARLDPDRLSPDPAARPPLTLLPPGERLAGSERLARGPVSLGTALGRLGGHGLRETLAGLQEALGGAPEWVLGDYHAREDSTGAIGAQTTLVLLAPEGMPAAESLLARAAELRPAELPVEALAALPGWIVRPPEGPPWFACVARERLWLGSSRLPAERLHAWLQLIAKEG